MGALVMQSRTAVYGWALLTNHAHLLLRSGPDGLPQLMRRFLTGYAQAYNRRHERHGIFFSLFEQIRNRMSHPARHPRPGDSNARLTASGSL